MQLTSITPIQPIKPLDALGKTEKISGSSSAIPFQSLLEEAVQNVKETQAAVDSENYKLATGQSDNLHGIEIASLKSTASIEMLTQLRNKVLDAYNEVMRISV